MNFRFQISDGRWIARRRAPRALVLVIPSAAQAGGGGRSAVEEPHTFLFPVGAATPNPEKAKLEVSRLRCAPLEMTKRGRSAAREATRASERGAQRTLVEIP